MVAIPGGLPAFVTMTVVAMAFQSFTTLAPALTNGMTATQNASAAARTLRDSFLMEFSFRHSTCVDGATRFLGSSRELLFFALSRRSRCWPPVGGRARLRQRFRRRCGHRR